MTLFLYDIDGTLLDSGGSGRAAMDLAFRRVLGLGGALEGISFLGRTDLAIAVEALGRHGLSASREILRELERAYLPLLERELLRRDGRLTVHPGARDLLEATGRAGMNGLLTGNCRGGARRKLEAVGLWSAFVTGAYGDDAERREDLVPFAVARAPRPSGRVVVIGDTPADVACARAAGATAVAVCTGWSSRGELEAAGPDLLLDDLRAGLERLPGLA